MSAAIPANIMSPPLALGPSFWADTRAALGDCAPMDESARQQVLSTAYRELVEFQTDSPVLARRVDRYLRAIEQTKPELVLARSATYRLKKVAVEKNIPLPSSYTDLCDDLKELSARLLAEGVPPQILLEFFCSIEVDLVIGHARFLELLAELKMAGVKGTSSAFKPLDHDRKIVSSEVARIRSLYAEYRAGLWTATNADVDYVAMDQNVFIDFASLNSQQQRFIEEKILEPIATYAKDHRSQKNPYTFKKRSSLSVDLICSKEQEDGSTKSWVTEVKSSTGTIGANPHDYSPFKALQLARLAMAVHTHKLAGIEMRLDAAKVHRAWLEMVIQIFHTLKTPYLIHLVDGNNHVLIRDEYHNLQFSYDVLDEEGTPQPIESVFKGFTSGHILNRVQRYGYGRVESVSDILKNGKTIAGRQRPSARTRATIRTPEQEPPVRTVTVSLQRKKPHDLFSADLTVTGGFTYLSGGITSDLVPDFSPGIHSPLATLPLWQIPG